MLNRYSLFRSLPTKSALLSLAFFIVLSFSSIPASANGPNNTVDVNARIQPARIVQIDGRGSSQTRKEAFTPVELTDFERTSAGRIEIREIISLSLGSNVSWNLTARVENLDESRAIIRSSGWKLKAFRLHWSGGKLKLNESAQTMTSGNRGRHELEVTYEVIILRAEDESNLTYLEELKNVLVFAFE